MKMVGSRKSVFRKAILHWTGTEVIRHRVNNKFLGKDYSGSTQKKKIMG